VVTGEIERVEFVRARGEHESPVAQPTDDGAFREAAYVRHSARARIGGEHVVAASECQPATIARELHVSLRAATSDRNRANTRGAKVDDANCDAAPT
jgi:hypothetical protein